MAQNKNAFGGAAKDGEHVKGSEVFVGGLVQSTTESTIREIFSPYGEIVELRMMKDQNGTSKGFCFVRFATKEAAFKALKEKDGTLIHGKRIGVAHSSDQDLLFFGNLRKDWSSDQFDKLVRQAFKDVVSVDLAMPSSTGNSHAEKGHLNRGFAFVQFSSHAAAARAHRMGAKPDFLLGGDWHPVIDWADKEPEIDPEELAKVKTAFVGNLPTNANEEFLMMLFGPLGKIEKVALSRKGRFPVGFVHFANRSDLNKAIKELDGKTVQGPMRGPNFKIQAPARAHRLGAKPDFLLGGDWHRVIDWADKELEIDPEELAKVKTAFVGNLPTNGNEEFLMMLFGPLGKIEKVALSRKGRFPVGFVHFANHSDLNKAIKELDGKTVQGSMRGPNFKIQVSIARPVEKK